MSFFTVYQDQMEKKCLLINLYSVNVLYVMLPHVKKEMNRNSHQYTLSRLVLRQEGTTEAAQVRMEGEIRDPVPAHYSVILLESDCFRKTSINIATLISL